MHADQQVRCSDLGDGPFRDMKNVGAAVPVVLQNLQSRASSASILCAAIDIILSRPGGALELSCATARGPPRRWPPARWRTEQGPLQTRQSTAEARQAS